jgi:tetratricopeptide (TPR) repeat protein
MSIEGLKEQARRHEQKEEWKKALDLYLRAIDRLAEEDQPDVGLYNRVGDLCVRVGDLERATQHYERAVELYAEAELPNNAIAVCKKIIRNVPTRNAVYLRMGRIRAQQGFLTDARQNFLTYAERVQASGNMEEALRALEELANLFPGDAEVHLMLAAQLQQHGRKSDAVEQLRAAYQAAADLGDAERASSIEAKAREIDSTVEFAAETTELPRVEPQPPETEGAFELGSSAASASFTEIRTDPGAELAIDAAEQDERDADDDGDEGAPVAVEPMEELEGHWPSFSIAAGDGGEAQVASADEEVEESEPLPSLFLSEGEEDVPGSALAIGESEPGLRLEMERDDEDDATPLPLLEWSNEETEPSASQPSTLRPIELDQAPGEAGVPASQLEVQHGLERAYEEIRPERRDQARTLEELISAGDLDGAERIIRDLMAREPGEISHRQRLVEVAYRRGDVKAQAAAYVELARCLELGGGSAQAEGVYQQALLLDPENASARGALARSGDSAATEVAPVASSDDYVDLGALIFGDDDEEKSTRFLVEYEEPTGDEQADFARMLSQFKSKIAQNVAADDVRAHHDLGTAYKEMGLLDEAIEEFQAALRASRDHLPTYELLGQCFIEKGQPDAAIKALQRALALGIEIEDELLGIYYVLGRAYEQTGNKELAVEYYDRVFSLDINFMDVTERLRALR